MRRKSDRRARRSFSSWTLMKTDFEKVNCRKPRKMKRLLVSKKHKFLGFFFFTSKTFSVTVFAAQRTVGGARRLLLVLVLKLVLVRICRHSKMLHRKTKPCSLNKRYELLKMQIIKRQRRCIN